MISDELRPTRVTADGWLSAFVGDGGDYERPWFCPGFCVAPGEIVADLVDAFERTRAAARGSAAFRVFVERGQRYDLAARVARQPRLPDEGLEAWLGRELGVSRFCVTFNAIGSWSERLARRVAGEFLVPLAEACGMPAGGADLYAFIGNYGDTPFGAHRDFDHSILWHLGPGDKDVYLWPHEQYVALTGSVEPTFDVDALVPHGERHRLRPGDLLYIPAGCFHVAQTRGFSMSLGVTLFPGFHDELLRHGLDLLLRERAQVDVGRLRGDDGSPPALRAAVAAAAGGSDATLGWDVAAAAERRLRQLTSNGYLRPPPRARTRPAALAGRRWRSPPPFRIGHVALPDGRSELFVRGHSLRLAAHPRLPGLLDGLGGAGLSTEEVVAQLSDRWSAGAAHHLLQLLFELGGIDAVDPAA